MTLPKLSTNASVVIVVAIGAICVAYLAISESPLAGTVIPVIATLVGGVVVQLLKQGATDAKVDAGVAVSQHNNTQLAAIGPRVETAAAQATVAADQSSVAVDALAENTDLTTRTKDLVNGQSHAIAAAAEENAQHRVELARQKAEITALVELARTTLAELAARREGIEVGRAQVEAEHAPGDGL